MKCFNCNSEIADNSSICPLCGATLASNNNVVGNNVNVQTNNIVDPVSPVNQVNNVGTGIEASIDPINNVQTMSNSINNIGVQNNNPIDVNYGMSPNNDFNVGVKEPQTNEIKGKSKTPFIIATILIIVVLGVAGVCGYIFMNSPKKVWTTIIDESSKKLSGYINSEVIKADTISTEFSFNTNVKASDTELSSMFDIINNVALNGKFQVDYKNKKALLDLDSKYKDGELLNVNGYITNEKAYVYLEGLYDKYISSEAEGINEIFEVENSTEDILIVYNEFMNALKSSLKEEYISTEKVTMTINGSETNVTKNILLLNDKNLTTLTRDILSILKANDNFLTSYSKISEIEKSEITSSIDETLSSLDNNYNSESNIQIILYTKGFKNEFVGFEYNQDLEYEKMNISIINDKTNTYTIKLVSDDEETVSGYVEIVGKEYKFKFGDEEVEFSGSITMENDGKVNLVFDMIVEGEKIGFELSYLTKYNETVTIPDVSNSIDYSLISDEDGMNILTKAMEKPGIKTIVEEIQDLNASRFPVSTYPSYNDSYSTDYSYSYDDEF